MPKSTPLADEVAKVAERVRKATKGKLNEQNTKASMIEPVLRASELSRDRQPFGIAVEWRVGSGSDRPNLSESPRSSRPLRVL